MRHQTLNFSWALIGNVGYLFFQWCLIAVLAKIGGPAPVGIYSLVLSFTAPIAGFLSMRMRYLQSTDADREFTFAEYVAHRLIAIGIGLALLAIALAGGVVPTSMVWITIAVSVSKLIDLLSDAYWGQLQSEDRMDLVAAGRIANSSITLILVTGVYSYTNNLDLAIQFSVVGSALSLGLTRYLTQRQMAQTPPPQRATLRRTNLWRLTTLGLPLGLAAGIVSLETFLPRFFILESLDESAVGVYSALAYSSLIILTLFDSMGNSFAPFLARIYKKQGLLHLDRLILKVAGLAIILTGVGCLAAWWLGDAVVKLVYSAEFTGHRDLLTLIILGAGIQAVASVIGWGVTILRIINIQAPIQAITTLAALAGFYWAGSTGDLVNFGWVMVAKSLVSLLLLWIVRWQALRVAATHD